MRTLFVEKSGNRKVGAIPVTYRERKSCPPSCTWYRKGCYGADDAHDAMELAGCHDTEYNLTAQFTQQDGGPEVGRAFIDDEVLPLEDV